MHSKDIVHCDIKTNNILVMKNNEIKLCDFGLSRYIPKGEKIYKYYGTLEYYPPEFCNLNNNGFDRSIDIWQLGITVYELLTGNTPFYINGDLDQDIKDKIIKGYNYDINISLNSNNFIFYLLRNNMEYRPDINYIENFNWLF